MSSETMTITIVNALRQSRHGRLVYDRSPDNYRNVIIRTDTNDRSMPNVASSSPTDRILEDSTTTINNSSNETVKINDDHESVRFTKLSKSFLRWEHDYRALLDENDEIKQMVVKNKSDQFDASLAAHRQSLSTRFIHTPPKSIVKDSLSTDTNVITPDDNKVESPALIAQTTESITICDALPTSDDVVTVTVDDVISDRASCTDDNTMSTFDRQNIDDTEQSSLLTTTTIISDDKSVPYSSSLPSTSIVADRTPNHILSSSTPNNNDQPAIDLIGILRTHRKASSSTIRPITTIHSSLPSNGIFWSGLKRTIREKITVTSKKLATDKEINGIIDYFNRLLIGESVIIGGDSKDRLCLNGNVEAIEFSSKFFLEVYINVVKHDISVVYMVAAVLSGIFAKLPHIEQVFVELMIKSSTLLSLNRHICDQKVNIERVKEDNALTAWLSNETSLIRLFFAVYATDRLVHGPAMLWHILAQILNRASVPIASAVVLNELIITCGWLLWKVYGNQFGKAIMCAKLEFVRQLERNLTIGSVQMSISELDETLQLRPNKLTKPIGLR